MTSCKDLCFCFGTNKDKLYLGLVPNTVVQNSVKTGFFKINLKMNLSSVNPSSNPNGLINMEMLAYSN